MARITQGQGGGVRHSAFVVAAVVEGLERRLFLSAGQLDPSFGSGGAAYGELFPGGSGHATALQSDGKIIAAGSANFGPHSVLALARFNANGLLDRAFGVDGRVTTNLGTPDESIAAVAIQGDGKIVVAGYAGDTHIAGNSDFIVARYLSSGALDSSFGAKGIATLSFLGLDEATSLVIQRNGAIVVAGQAQAGFSGMTTEFALARLTTAGALDSTFGQHGKVLMAFPGPGAGINSLLIQSNGDLIASSTTDSASGYYNTTLVRYLPRGTLDPSFGTGGVATSGAVFTIGGMTANPSDTPAYAVLAPNGQIDVVTTSGGVPNSEFSLSNAMYLERFNANGTLDTTFGKAGLASFTADFVTPNSIMIQKNGDIVVAGTDSVFEATSEVVKFLFVRFNSHGVVGTVTQTPFAGPGTGGNAIAYAAVEQPDQRIIIVGQTILGSNNGDFALARYTLAGVLDSSFGYHGTVQQPNGITGLVQAIAVQKDQKILIAGSEQSPDPATQPTDAAIARYNANGTLDASFGVDGRVFLRIGNQLQWNAIKVEPNGDILVGGDAVSNGVSQAVLVRYLPNGLPDQSFGVGGEVALKTVGSETITSLALLPNGNFITGGTETSGGIGVFDIARYLPNGAIDKTFGAYSDGHTVIGYYDFRSMPENATLVALLIAGNNDILIGGSVGDHFELAALLPSGLTDTSFAGGFNTGIGTWFINGPATLTSLAIDPATGDIVAGGYVDVNENAHDTAFALARYTPGGILDSTFGAGGELTAQVSGADQIQSVAVQSDGKIVAGGVSSPSDVLQPSSGVRPFLGQPMILNAVVLRFTSKGLDPTFGQGGLTYLDGGINEENEAATSCVVTLQSDGKILAADLDLYRLTGK